MPLKMDDSASFVAVNGHLPLRHSDDVISLLIHLSLILGLNCPWCFAEHLPEGHHAHSHPVHLDKISSLGAASFRAGLWLEQHSQQL